MFESTSSSTSISPVYRSATGSSMLDPHSRISSEGGSLPMTPSSPKSKLKEEFSPSSSSGVPSQLSSVDISVSVSPLVQPPPNTQQEHTLTPPKPLSDPSSSNSDINDFERLVSLLSTVKDELQINSGIHVSCMQAPVQPPPGTESSLQSNHILHERWCEECRKSFYGAQCDSHVSVYDADFISDNERQEDRAPSLPLVSSDKSDPRSLTSESAIPPNNMLTPANASVIIQQFGTSERPPTCTIILNDGHSKEGADHCAPSSSLSTSGRVDAPIIVHTSKFEGENKFYHGHARKINRCHCHCQVSLLRSDSSSSSSPRASEDSDDDRLSCGCARRQFSRSPSPPRHQSHSKYRTTSPVHSASGPPPELVNIPTSPLSPRFMYEPHWPHSEKYYFEDGTVVFRVGMLLYKVHRHFFDRYSTFFHDLFSTINLDARDIDDPIFLAEIEPHDFECLLSVFYPRSFDKSDLSAADWTSILSLSTRWSFADIRQSAVNHLAPNGIITPVEKIVLGTKYDVREWLAPAYGEVCLRARPLDLEEGARLGSERVVKIAKLRMEFGLEMGMAAEREPCGRGEARVRVPSDAPARIRQTFGLDLI